MKLLSAAAGLIVAAEGAALAANVQSVLQSVLGLDQSRSSKPPNFLFVITDDQDLELDSVSYTPHIQRHLRDKGTFFRNHFVTTALCCPSRVSLWTGRQAHNTNVTDVNPPYGGFPKFVDRGFNENFLPVWLQEAGYDTYYTGKLFNSHTINNYDSPHVNGFNGSDFLLDPYTYSYLNSTYQRNHEPPVSYEGHHTTDVITKKALGFLDDALEGERPFFVTIAPVAPHSNVDPSSLRDGHIFMSAPIPLQRHQHLFEDVKVPRKENFNPDKPSGVSWVRDLPQQNQTVVDYNDYFYRSRLRALQGVDELVDSLVTRLEETDKLDNTYIIYTSDNGFHIGQHRLPPGKTCGFEEDIRVPLFVRGPGVPEGYVQDSVTTHIDLAPTIFNLAGIPARADFDGTAIPVTPDFAGPRHEHVTVEYWGRGVAEGDFSGIGPGGDTMIPNNTYKSVRLLGQGYNLYYSVWCNNEHELYDLSVDPYQLHNLYPTSARADDDEPRILGRSLSQAITRLDALLLVLKSCQGAACIAPWDVLQPKDSVRSLQEALDERFDAFYGEQPQVSFDWCDAGYIIEAEGPQVPLTSRYGLPWDVWV
ncbi:Alkaline phosphatase-like alpha/beta/alpha [Penicillium hispanicum]|uniref:Alkaline phosphatase-like alpha/beta/alpha n=1 Tax=Penicillium hispanicum TaxID=1080232 RepID=UPI0025408F13|nr:Alkaline phosphatase-like alpha/beta/alpha [Penicillium hispanicum]KAJ5584753.1 Alkaline phosphatase-like alpha/beta/alpha [Penicillium hispanicum]